MDSTSSEHELLQDKTKTNMSLLYSMTSELLLFTQCSEYYTFYTGTDRKAYYTAILQHGFILHNVHNTSQLLYQYMYAQNQVCRTFKAT